MHYAWSIEKKEDDAVFLNSKHFDSQNSLSQLLLLALLFAFYFISQ